MRSDTTMSSGRRSTRRLEPLVRMPPGFEGEFPGCSALASDCFLNFGLVAGGAQAALHHLLAERGVPSLAAFNVLTIVHGAGAALAPSTIAERMMVSRPTVTGVLDSLEARRLITRRAHRDDGRRRLVALTRDGVAAVEALLPEVHAFERDVMGCLTPAEQRQLLRVLARLEDHIPRVAPGAEIKLVE